MSRFHAAVSALLACAFSTYANADPAPTGQRTTVVIAGKAVQFDSSAPAAGIEVYLTVPGVGAASAPVSTQTSDLGLFDLVYESEIDPDVVFLSCAPPARCRVRDVSLTDDAAGIRAVTLTAPLRVRATVLPARRMSSELVRWHLRAILEAAALQRLTRRDAPNDSATPSRGHLAALIAAHRAAGAPDSQLRAAVVDSRAHVEQGALRALPDLTDTLDELVAMVEEMLRTSSTAFDRETEPDGIAALSAVANGVPLFQSPPWVALPGEAEGESPHDSRTPLDLASLDGIEPPDEVIVITGTAIRRPVPHDLLPVTIFDRDTLQASGVASVGDFLQDMPMNYNGRNRQYNNQSDGTTRVNLRGLGEEHTLVLINNRRYLPAHHGDNGSIDLNEIPMTLVERIEVLSGGASSVYGTGAMSGVVNVVMRDDIRGAQATGYVGTTGDGSGSVVDVSTIVGHSSKRGRAVASVSFYEQQAIEADAREFSRQERIYDWEQSPDSPFANPDSDNVWLPNGSSATPAGLLIDRTGAPGNQDWQDIRSSSCMTGVCRIDTMTDFRNPMDRDLGDLYNNQPDKYLLMPLRRVTGRLALSYHLGSGIDVFVEVMANHQRLTTQLAPTPLFTISEGLGVDASNYYNPYGRDFLDIRRRFVELGPRQRFTRRSMLHSVFGLRGRIPARIPVLANWRWSVHGNRSAGKYTDTRPSTLIRKRLAEALGPSHVVGDGAPRCGTAQSPEPADCVPLNLFGGAGTITAPMLNYVTADLIGAGRVSQRLFGVETEGKLLTTPWNGDIRLALGAETRTSHGEFVPDPLAVRGEPVGIRQLASGGSFRISSTYGELSVVPLTGYRGARWLAFNAGLRLAKANSFQYINTWKMGGIWKPTAWLTLRGVYSRNARAPDLDELFPEVADSLQELYDPCNSQNAPLTPRAMANCANDGIPADFRDQRTRFPVQTGSALRTLITERADTRDLRLALQPPSIPGLQLVFTYFDIDLSNQIRVQDPQFVLNECYEGGDESACELISRDPENWTITQILAATANMSDGLHTAGLDTTLEYRHATSFGTFRHRFLGTWLREYTYRRYELGREYEVQGAGVYDSGAFPRWKFNLSSLWNWQRFGAGFNLRYIGSFNECEDNDCKRGQEFSEQNPEPLSRTIDARITADLHGRIAFTSAIGPTTLEFGVNNIADSSYVAVANGTVANSDAATYDFAGRFGYLRLTQKF